MRRLRLLGPTTVDQLPETQRTAADHVGEGRNYGKVPRFRSRTTFALLGYLAAEKREVGREYLASLFWPDETPSKGRGNLRRELHNAGKPTAKWWLSFPRPTRS